MNSPTSYYQRTYSPKIIGLLLFSSSLLILSSCVKDDLSNVSTSKMSCAGIMTNPRCVKSCTHDAVATCEELVMRKSFDIMHKSFEEWNIRRQKPQSGTKGR